MRLRQTNRTTVIYMVIASGAFSKFGQRHLAIALAAFLTVLLAATIASLATGGRPDAPELRAASQLLAGPWRFHTGDDAQWADPSTSDGDWETIDLTPAKGSRDGDVGLPDYVAGWMAHGHADYRGYAWYRRAVTVPKNDSGWEILGPTMVEHAYELYWNGQLLGGSGKLGERPRAVGTRPTKFALPSNAAGSVGILAVRVLMLPGDAAADGGGMHSAPILSPRPVSDRLHRAQWERTVAGYIVDAIEPLAIFVLVAIALAYRSRSNSKQFLTYASIALAFMAARRLNNAIVSWTDWQDLRTYTWLAKWMWLPAVVAWALAWNRFVEERSRAIDLLAAMLAGASLVGIAIGSANTTLVSRWAWIAMFVALAARVVRTREMRMLAIVTVGTIVLGLFGGELLDPFGVLGIWFPFGIGVSRTQYIYAGLIPFLALLMFRSIRPRTFSAEN